ncbi:DNA polymerase [Intrasporangium sp. DVR]|uniref:DNA polymerase n=1 Tax=Intrasporangium sp. DVR TaxID=3127867 RepID=UPI00313A52B6
MSDHPPPAPLVALVVGPHEAYAAGPGLRESWPLAEVASRVARMIGSIHPRWVVWSAENALRGVVAAGVDVPRSWDLAEAHRLLHGGWRATPGDVWAGCRGLRVDDVPVPRRGRQAGFDGDLFDLAERSVDELLTESGHLRADALEGWATGSERLGRLADLALTCQREQEGSLRARGGDGAERLIRTVWSESAAAVLCLELERDGLPVDRLAAEDLISAAAGPRPRDDADAARIRAQRDHAVLRHAPGRERADLRNPAQVRTLLQSVGVDVPHTRAWVLEPYRPTHALVDALLTWRKNERVATTYGYRWLDEHVGADDRLRGRWTACDGAAGRMTAQNGLHNLPAPLRPAIRAEPGYVFVRADLGQVEPRVLAVVSGDRAFAEATRSDDLYAPVAAKLGIERSVAKVAVLAAMYGQRSGAAGEALKDLERAYPVAMDLLDRAYADGVARRSLRTYGGRLIPFGIEPVPADPPRADGAGVPGSEPSGIRPDVDRGGSDAARGRFARNAIIQGSAAELFKAWAATVRHAVRPLGGQIVLCLHDELLVHVPQARAGEAQRAVQDALGRASHTWAGTDVVRFVADASVITRWSEAKD